MNLLVSQLRPKITLAHSVKMPSKNRKQCAYCACMRFPPNCSVGHLARSQRVQHWIIDHFQTLEVASHRKRRPFINFNLSEKCVSICHLHTGQHRNKENARIKSCSFVPSRNAPRRNARINIFVLPQSALCKMKLLPVFCGCLQW